MKYIDFSAHFKQQQRSEIKSRGAENKIGLSITISPPPNIFISPATSPSFAAVSFSICWQLCFDAAVRNDSIVLFEGIRDLTQQDGRMTKKCRARLCIPGLACHFFVILPSWVFQPSCYCQWNLDRQLIRKICKTDRITHTTTQTNCLNMSSQDVRSCL